MRPGCAAFGVRSDLDDFYSHGAQAKGCCPRGTRETSGLFEISSSGISGLFEVSSSGTSGLFEISSSGGFFEISNSGMG